METKTKENQNGATAKRVQAECKDLAGEEREYLRMDPSCRTYFLEEYESAWDVIETVIADVLDALRSHGLQK